MAEDKMKKVQDRHRIDVRENYELRYWTKKFGVTKQRLEAAIRKVGPHAEDVAIELDAKWNETDFFRVINGRRM